MDKLKQAILVRKDLDLSRGKIASQVAHASVEATLDSLEDIINKWREQGQPKIVLGVKDLQELKFYIEKAKEKGLITSLVEDEGLTSVKSGTITCGVLGPDREEVINSITGELKLFS